MPEPWVSEAWHALPDPQKQLYRRLADGMTGFNLFVSRTVDAVWNGREPEVPVLLECRTADPEPVANGDLIVRRGGKDVFHVDLEEGKGEIALTPSDGPYTFVLRKGAKEDPVLTVKDLPETDVPLALESPALGMRLELIVPDLPPEERPDPEPVRGTALPLETPIAVEMQGAK